MKLFYIAFVPSAFLLAIQIVKCSAEISKGDRPQDMCPCLPITVCPRPFDASSQDAKYLGEILKCAQPDYVRCCGTSTNTVPATKESLANNRQQKALNVYSANNRQVPENMLEEHSDEKRQLAEQSENDKDFEDEDFVATTTTTVNPRHRRLRKSRRKQQQQNDEKVTMVYPSEMSGIPKTTPQSMTKDAEHMRMFDTEIGENLHIVFPKKNLAHRKTPTTESSPEEEAIHHTTTSAHELDEKPVEDEPLTQENTESILEESPDESISEIDQTTTILPETTTNARTNRRRLRRPSSKKQDPINSTTTTTEKSSRSKEIRSRSRPESLTVSSTTEAVAANRFRGRGTIRNSRRNISKPIEKEIEMEAVPIEEPEVIHEGAEATVSEVQVKPNTGDENLMTLNPSTKQSLLTAEESNKPSEFTINQMGKLIPKEGSEGSSLPDDLIDALSGPDTTSKSLTETEKPVTKQLPQTTEVAPTQKPKLIPSLPRDEMPMEHKGIDTTPNTKQRTNILLNPQIQEIFSIEGQVPPIFLAGGSGVQLTLGLTRKNKRENTSPLPPVAPLPIPDYVMTQAPLETNTKTFTNYPVFTPHNSGLQNAEMMRMSMGENGDESLAIQTEGNNDTVMLPLNDLEETEIPILVPLNEILADNLPDEFPEYNSEYWNVGKTFVDDTNSILLDPRENGNVTEENLNETIAEIVGNDDPEVINQLRTMLEAIYDETENDENQHHQQPIVARSVRSSTSSIRSSSISPFRQSRNQDIDSIETTSSSTTSVPAPTTNTIRPTFKPFRARGTVRFAPESTETVASKKPPHRFMSRKSAMSKNELTTKATTTKIELPRKDLFHRAPPSIHTTTTTTTTSTARPMDRRKKIILRKKLPYEMMQETTSTTVGPEENELETDEEQLLEDVMTESTSTSTTTATPARHVPNSIPSRDQGRHRTRSQFMGHQRQQDVTLSARRSQRKSHFPTSSAESVMPTNQQRRLPPTASSFRRHRSTHDSTPIRYLNEYVQMPPTNMESISIVGPIPFALRGKFRDGGNINFALPTTKQTHFNF